MKHLLSFLLMITFTIPLGYFLRVVVYFSDGTYSFNIVSCIITGFITAFGAVIITKYIIPSVKTSCPSLFSGILMVPFFLLGIWVYLQDYSLESLLASAATFGLIIGFVTHPLVAWINRRVAQRTLFTSSRYPDTQ